MAVNGKARRTGRGNGGLVITVIFVGLVLFAFFYYVYPRMTSSGGRSDRQLTLPRVSASVTSSADGSSHVVDMDIVLEVTRKSVQDVTAKELKVVVEDVVKEMDFERIVGEGNTEYIKSEISKELEKHVGAENLKGIYLVDIQSDEVRLLNPAPPEGTQRRNDILKGIFKNLEE